MNRSSMGAAHTGLGEWLVQRVSALYLAGFAIYVVFALALWPILDQAAWKAWLAPGPVRIAWALFFLSALVHAWIGLRSVFMDYLRPAWLRFAVSLVTALGLIALGFWAAEILLRAGA